MLIRLIGDSKLPLGVTAGCYTGTDVHMYPVWSNNQRTFYHESAPTPVKESEFVLTCAAGSDCLVAE